MQRVARIVVATLLPCCAACQVVGSIDAKESADAAPDARDAAEAGSTCAKSPPSVDEPHYPSSGDAFAPGAFMLDAANGVVTDTASGLVYERQPVPGLTYEAAQCRCRALRLASASDWRLASRYELAPLVDYIKVIPAITGPAFDAALFPLAPVDYYWTSTLFASSNAAAVDLPFYVLLGDGRAVGAAQTGSERASAWCVRGGKAPSAATRFVAAADTVTDAWTRLVWQRGAPPEASSLRPAAAASYCSGLQLGGAGGFRLPSVKELESLVAAGRRAPAIDTGLFPGTPSALSHTSATYSAQPGDTRWYVDFADGSAIPVSLRDSQAVRCVRPLP